MTTYTRNIGLRRFMGVTEKVTFSYNDKDTKVCFNLHPRSLLIKFDNPIKVRVPCLQA